MPKRSKYIVKPGATVRVELPKIAGVGARQAGAGEESKALRPSDADDELYVFRKSGLEVTFHDLGTALRSVPPLSGEGLETRYRSLAETDAPARHDGWMNEYVEREFEMNVARSIVLPGDPGEPVSGDPNWIRIASDPITEEMERAIEARLLGNRVTGSADAFDPFGTTQANGSGRELPNCWTLPYEATELWVDVYYSDDGQSLYIPLTPPERRTAVDDITFLPQGVSTPELEDIISVYGEDHAFAEERPTVGSSDSKWKEREALPADSSELWNPINLAEMGAQKEGHIKKLKVKGKGYFRIRTAGIYEEFDMTANKITEQRYDDDGNALTPSPDDPVAAEAWIAKGDRVRFYLKPKAIIFFANVKIVHALWQSPTVIHEGIPFILDTWKGRTTAAVTAAFAGRLPVYPRWIGKRLRDSAGNIVRHLNYPSFWRGPDVGIGVPVVNTVRTVLGDFNSLVAPDLSVTGQPVLPYYHYIDRNPKIAGGVDWPYYESHDHDDVNDYFRGSAGALSSDPLAVIEVHPPSELITPPPVRYYYEHIYEPSLTFKDGYEDPDGLRLDRHIITNEYFSYRRFLVGAMVKNGKTFYFWNHLTVPPFPLINQKPNSVVVRIDTRQLYTSPFYRPKPYSTE